MDNLKICVCPSDDNQTSIVSILPEGAAPPGGGRCVCRSIREFGHNVCYTSTPVHIQSTDSRRRLLRQAILLSASLSARVLLVSILLWILLSMFQSPQKKK